MATYVREAIEVGDHRTRLDALVLDGGSRQSLVTVRSLGRRHLSVGAMETFAHAPAFASRWCKARFVCPGGYATAAYLRSMEEALDQTGASLLVPSHDGTIALLREHRARIQARARIALASEHALEVAVSKPRTLAIAEELGIPTPPGVNVATLEDLPEALEIVGLPAVIKPSESWFARDGHGARFVPKLARTSQEAEHHLVDLMRFGGQALLQMFIPGRREAVSLLYAEGTVHARFAQWAQRTNPPLGGDSVLRQSIPVPRDIGDASERLVRELNLEGYSEVEFRRDEDGAPRLMEINPRLSASVEIAVRSGVDFPWLFRQWAMGEPVDHVDGYRTGGWMRYLGGDVRSTLETMRLGGGPGLPTPARAAFDFTSAFFRPMGYDYLDLRDPIPAFQATGGFLRHAVVRVLKGDRPAAKATTPGYKPEGEAATAHAP